MWVETVCIEINGVGPTLEPSAGFPGSISSSLLRYPLTWPAYYAKNASHHHIHMYVRTDEYLSDIGTVLNVTASTTTARAIV